MDKDCFEDLLGRDTDEMTKEELSEYERKLEEYIGYLESLSDDEETEEKIAEAEDTLYFVRLING